MIDTATWVKWEIRNYLLQTEMPGKFGTYGQEVSHEPKR